MLYSTLIMIVLILQRVSNKNGVLFIKQYVGVLNRISYTTYMIYKYLIVLRGLMQDNMIINDFKRDTTNWTEMISILIAL